MSLNKNKWANIILQLEPGVILSFPEWNVRERFRYYQLIPTLAISFQGSRFHYDVEFIFSPKQRKLFLGKYFHKNERFINLDRMNHICFVFIF